MMRSTAFIKITVVYGRIDENGHAVRKWPARKMAITDKMVKNSRLSVKIQAFWTSFTDKRSKNSTLSVNPSEILARCQKKKKSAPCMMEQIFIIIQLRTGS
ncbi:MAG: hypothetical protein PUC19_05615 [Ligilactobacillus ruminis]|nr:hypothetical protein [Ligilactobacillus ruminis]